MKQRHFETECETRQGAVRLTMAQARYLCNQFTEIAGERAPLSAGVFGVLGHGNVACLSDASEAVQDQLPTVGAERAVHAAGRDRLCAKAKMRRQIMIATSSDGAGHPQHGDRRQRRPFEPPARALLSGDVFADRVPDPVLQQVEHFGDPAISVNDAYQQRTFRCRKAPGGCGGRRCV
jgi:3D-(3,5/4)-trihydroxycyclohexane-1,2-dione acylhydrolase (decyclizing)